MAITDFATVEVYSDDLRVELYVPYTQRELGNFVKDSFGARFKTDGNKKRWVVELKFAKVEADAVVKAVEEKLYDLARPDWRKIVAMFVNYACASKRYEVKFAAGGVRIMLPGGHPLHFYLGEMCGLKPERDVWKIPANLIKPKTLADMLKRIASEDREVFTEATEPYMGRRASGLLLLPFSEAKAYNLKTDGVVFADYAFVKKIDPQVVPMQIHAWPFRVLKTTPTEGGMDASLEYVSPGIGAKAVGKFMALPPERRPHLLDEVHAEGKWKTKSAY